MLIKKENLENWTKQFSNILKQRQVCFAELSLIKELICLLPVMLIEALPLICLQCGFIRRISGQACR